MKNPGNDDLSQNELSQKDLPQNDLSQNDLPKIEDLDILSLAGTKAKGKRPYFLDNPEVERVLAITMAIAGEVAVLRQRLDTVEELLAERGSITKADIDAFQPDSAQAESRGRWNQEYLARILRIVQQEREGIAKSNEPSAEDIGHTLAD